MTVDTENKWRKSIVSLTWDKLCRFPVWRKVLLLLVLAAMMMVASVMAGAYLAGRRLSREVIKISKAHEPLVYADLRPEPSNQGIGEDAGIYYVEAVKRIRPGDLQDIVKLNIFYRLNMLSLPADKFPGELREKTAQNLSKAEPLFTILDKGAKLPLSEFDTGVLQGRQICKERLDSIQGMLFLTSLRTLDLLKAGKVDRAMQSIVTSIKLIRSFDSFPTMFVQGRKMICVRLICSDIKLLLFYGSGGAGLSEQQLEQLQLLLDEAFGPDALEKTLLAERIYQLEVGRNLISKRIASRYLSPDVPPLSDRLADPKFMWHRMRFRFNAARFMRDMAWLIDVSRLPWPGPLEKVKDANSTPSKGASGLISTVAPLAGITAETLVSKEVTETILAIERYRRAEKAIPDSLNDVCPQYIKSIPIDPFTGQPILYTHDDKTYKVFSAANVRIDDVNSIVPKK